MEIGLGISQVSREKIQNEYGMIQANSLYSTAIVVIGNVQLLFDRMCRLKQHGAINFSR